MLPYGTDDRLLLPPSIGSSAISVSPGRKEGIDNTLLGSPSQLPLRSRSGMGMRDELDYAPTRVAQLPRESCRKYVKAGPHEVLQENRQRISAEGEKQLPLEAADHARRGAQTPRMVWVGDLLLAIGLVLLWLA